MAKQIKPQTAWAVYDNHNVIRMAGGTFIPREKLKILYCGPTWNEFKEAGWTIKRVRVEVVKPKKRSRR